MISLLMVIAAGVFAVGIVVGAVVMVSIGIRAEERQEGPFFQGGIASRGWRTQ